MIDIVIFALSLIILVVSALLATNNPKCNSELEIHNKNNLYTNCKDCPNFMKGNMGAENECKLLLWQSVPENEISINCPLND